MGKDIKNQEYFIYNENDELEDVVVLSKKELIAFKRKFPNYMVEPVGTDYRFEDLINEN